MIWAAFAGSVALLSLLLASTLPVRAFPSATADDALFVNLAHHILAGAWLGPYDGMTLVKGAFVPLFLAGSSLVGLPLKTSEQLVALAASAVAASMLWRIGLDRRAAAIAFALLALNPIPWHPDLVRVTRDSLYSQLGLAVFALAALGLLDRRLSRRAHLAVLFGFGVCFSAYWLTREESVWLYPSLLVLASGAIVRTTRQPRSTPLRWRRPAAWLAARAGVVAAGFAVPAGSIAFLNWIHYGVFLTNEVREGAMPSAYGALLRVRPELHVRGMSFSDAAAAVVYEVSPAARELEPSLEGYRGRAWREIGCRELKLDRCPPGFSGGWFMWALRDAVYEAGHMTTARDAQSFYRRLAREIDAACAARQIGCGPQRESMAPPLRLDDLAALRSSAVAALRYLVSFGGGSVGAMRSEGSEDGIARFREIAGPVSPAPPSAVAHALMSAIARAYALGMPLLAIAGGIGTLAAIASRRALADRAALALVAGASLVAVAVRSALIAYVDATSFPAVNIQYLSPGAPFLIIAVVLGIQLGGTALLRPAVGAAR